MDINNLCPHCMREISGGRKNYCPHCGKVLSKVSEVKHQLKPFTILQGKYLVGEVLGEGGFGITYIGFDLNLEIRIAIKEFYPNGYATREANITNELTAYAGQSMEVVYKWRDNFLKEARSLAKCAHLSGVVGVKDFFQENSTAYIVQEYLEGVTLKEYIKEQGGKVSIKWLLTAIEPVMMALGEVHKEGLIHRDISPDNIMLLRDGRMKLLDFGAARDYNDSGEKSLSVLLKPGYAPEEQYRTKGKQGPWSDIYALGGTIYKCITGITPPEAMERMRQDELRKPSELGIEVSKSEEKALLKAMSVFSENRYQSMEEFYSELYKKDSLKGMQGNTAGAEKIFTKEKSNKKFLSTTEKAAEGIKTVTGKVGEVTSTVSKQMQEKSAEEKEKKVVGFQKKKVGMVVGAIFLVIICVVIIVGGKRNKEEIAVNDKKGAAEQEVVSTDTSEEKVEGVDVQTVLTAYQNYIDDRWNETWNSFGKCVILDIENDSIPECFYVYSDNIGNAISGVLYYKDGKVINVKHEQEKEGQYWVQEIGYEAGKNIFYFYESTGTWSSIYYFYEISEEGYKEIGRAGLEFTHVPESETVDFYFVESSDNKVSEEVFDNYIKNICNISNMCRISNAHSDMSLMIEEAYKIFCEVEAINDVTTQFGINPNTVENYAANLDPYTFRKYDSGISDFYFSYPVNLYNTISFDEESVEGAYGTYMQKIAFLGTNGSECIFSITKRSENYQSIEDMANTVYCNETATLNDATKLKYVVEADYAKVIVTGYNDTYDKLIYDMTKVNGEYVMQMIVVFPSYTSGEDKLQKDYITECLYRMCGFSGSSEPARSYQEYKDYWEEYL